MSDILTFEEFEEMIVQFTIQELLDDEERLEMVRGLAATLKAELDELQPVRRKIEILEDRLTIVQRALEFLRLRLLQREIDAIEKATAVFVSERPKLHGTPDYARFRGIVVVAERAVNFYGTNRAEIAVGRLREAARNLGVELPEAPPAEE
jgi:hypothetical protein